MNSDLYVAYNDYDGGFVGTLAEIQEHMITNDWLFGATSFYKVEKEVTIKFEEDK